MSGDRLRGQAHTLEGVASALLVLLGLVFALQVTVVTPLTASTANQHISNQLEGATTGTLDVADEHGELRRAALSWDEDAGNFHDAGSDGHYGWSATDNDFLSRLDRTFFTARVAYNVDLVYLTPDSGRDERTLVRSGHPADNAVTVDRLVTLYDDDHLRTASGGLASTTLEGSSSFYAPDALNGTVYNVVRLEVTVWQT